MKIIIFELEDWERDAFKELSEEHELVLTSASITTHLERKYTDADIISTTLGSDLNAKSLQQISNLKLICTRTTGFDHIDLDYCRQNGITVCNVPHYADCTVAEHVFALLLAISHKIVDSVTRTRAGNFSLKGLRGFDLKDKVLGVIGTGAIGRCVIEIARGFKMQVLAYDLRPDVQFESKMGIRYTGMDDLLASSDIITLHVPSIPETRNLIARTQFEKMKKGMIIINTARGDVIDMQSLLQALTDGTVSAAGLDVLPEEPAIREEAELLRSIFTRRYNLEMLLADHVLAHLPNVIITPHSAFDTIEAVERLLDNTRQNIQAFIAGEPINVVSSLQRIPAKPR